jgi:hypothetical protein
LDSSISLPAHDVTPFDTYFVRRKLQVIKSEIAAGEKGGAAAMCAAQRLRRTNATKRSTAVPSISAVSQFCLIEKAFRTSDPSVHVPTHARSTRIVNRPGATMGRTVPLNDDLELVQNTRLNRNQ